MNDDELGLRLSDELRRRIDPPVGAPEAVHEHLRRLRSMREVRPAGKSRPGRLLRDLSGLAAAVGAIALVAGVLIWRSSPPATSVPVPAPKDGIEAFGRIDSRTAWAESGSTLYMTRDGGLTWSQGTVPGGKSPLEANDGFSAGSTGTGAWAAPSADASSRSQYPDHYYPVFIDADHGWLLSWTTSGTGQAAPGTMTVWRTLDGGASWVSNKVAGSYEGVAALQFADESHGWITILKTGPAGSDGSQPLPADATTILATTDGGSTWSIVSTIAAIAMPHFVSSTEAWGYAVSSSTSASIVHSTDGGRTWSISPLPIRDDRRLIDWPAPPAVSNGSVSARLPSVIVNSQVDDGSGGSLVILTVRGVDGGRSWGIDETRLVDVAGRVNGGWLGLSGIKTEIVLQMPAGQPILLVDASGARAGEPPGFQATFDGGATWTALSTRGLPGTAVRLAEWTSPDDAWVVTGSDAGTLIGGQLYATQDAGKAWKPLLGAAAWPASPGASVAPATLGKTP